MKTTKGGKVMNPTDAYRKELRKKELKRNKKERKKVREVGILKKDPDTLKDQIDKLEAMKADGALDKARKHKKRQLEDTLNRVMKKRKEYEDKMKEKGEAPVMFSHLGPPRRLTNAEEEERVKHPKPEDSVYYHPTLNPTGAPPPGKPPMFKSSIGPRIPLSEASSSGAAASSAAESDDVAFSVPPPPPPPPPPLPQSGDEDSKDNVIPASLPLPPPPLMPVKTEMPDLATFLPPPPLPPPPPGPPPKEQIAARPSLPPPPPPPGTGGIERDNLRPVKLEEPIQASIKLPPPPPPPGLPSKLSTNQSEKASSESERNNALENKEFTKMVPPPPPGPPPRQQPLAPGPGLVQGLQPDILPPGILRFPPPPPPPEMRPPLSSLGIPGQPPPPPPPPGMMVPMLPRPPFGLPPMMRPPLPPGPPPFLHDDHSARPTTVPQKPSYVKSAASTVVKRPLAQHTPQLTSMVPASVRVRRESTAPKAKPKPPSVSSVAAAPAPRPITAPPVVMKKESVKSSSSSSAGKPQSIDDSYTAFLEDMKALGALDG